MRNKFKLELPECAGFIEESSDAIYADETLQAVENSTKIAALPRSVHPAVYA
jgi:hypothetical protein